MKKFLLIIVTFSLLLCTSCSHIKDTNGEDDYSLCDITDKDIIKGRSSLSVVSTEVNSKNSVKYTAKKVSGVLELKSVDLDEGDTLVIEYDIKVESGNARVCLVTDEILLDLNINDTNTVSYTAPKTDNYQFKLAAESAKVALVITIHR
ncbi:MAG: hypothetical protein IJA65_03220 [Acholeplasmatales bacterium]|nr:hypothetical protein [Acholeplasmatales bacterium]